MNVEIEVNGRTYEGRYVIEGGLVRATSDYGEKTTQIGDSPVETVAKLLLHELVQAHLHSGS
jgi:hypothetical protein